MEKRDTKVFFGKSGNGISAKMNIPMPWLRKMDITPDEKDVIISYDEATKTITIQKK